jgi:AbrB family looped-hinge helix DNA binding protein
LIPKPIIGSISEIGINPGPVALAQAVKIIEGGKLVIPAAMRRAMGIARGDTVVVELLSNGDLRVRPLASAIREAQEVVRKSVRPDRSLADELMRERKRDAVRE